VNWQFRLSEKLPENPTPAERKAIDRASWFASDQSGYFREQGTRPQTIGYPLADSAAGQALWIYEKFQAWTITTAILKMSSPSMRMLDDISLYWFTDTAASSAASTGRTPAPAWRACPADGSNCQWRRRSFRTRYSGPPKGLG